MPWYQRELDLRALALFRIALGGFLLCDVWLRVLPGFASYFSPETGILGRAFAEGVATDYGYSNPVFSIVTDAGMFTFFGLQILFLALFVIGVFPQLMAALSAVLLWAFHVRFSTFYLGWDMYASALLVWAAVLPVGQRLAFVSIPIKAVDGHRWRSALGTVFLIQIGLIYSYNALSKNGELWMHGQAINSMLLELDKHGPLAAWLMGKQWITVPLSYITLAWEWAVLLLLLWTPRWPAVRNVAALSLVLFHWGMALFVDVGEFKFVALAGAVGCLILPAGAGSVGVKWLVQWKWFQHRKPLGEGALALALLLCILISNLHNHSISNTNDRVKTTLNRLRGNTNKPLFAFWHAMPQYSFFQQFWHLYAPDPPTEKGYVRLEAVTLNADTVDVFDGKLLNGRGHYVDRQQKFLFLFVANRKLRNKREMRMASSLVTREIKLWNKDKTRPRLQRMELVIYSYKPTVAQVANPAVQPTYSRQVLFDAAINYRH